MLNYPSQAIGVFDSGVGGISVLKHIRDTLPHEDLIYVADSYYAPYGNQTPEFIRERTQYLASFLIEQGAKALVIACNTATAAAASALREQYPALPIIGMEPAVKPAAAATHTKVIGVLATSGTLKSAQFAALLENYGQNVNVVTQACIGLVECIERGELTSNATKQLIQQYLKPLLDAQADTIVLGCTHYPFVRPLIENIIQEISSAKITIIDTGAAVARQLQHRLNEAGVLTKHTQLGSTRFWTNNPHSNAHEVITQLWGKESNILQF